MIGGQIHSSTLGWVDKLAFAVFGGLVLGLGAWNLHTAHQNAIQIAEVRVEVRSLQNNPVPHNRKELAYIRDRLDSLEEDVKTLIDKK